MSDVDDVIGVARPPTVDETDSVVGVCWDFPVCVAGGNTPTPSAQPRSPIKIFQKSKEIPKYKQSIPKTEQQLLAELQKKLLDRDWRICNLYQILDEGGNRIQFTLRGEQEQFLRESHSRNLVPKARKLGMSTLIVLLYLDSCLFTPNFKCGHIDLKEPDAWEKLQIARFAWEQGPNHPNPGIAEMWKLIHAHNPITVDNNGELGWSNGSRQTAGVSYTGKTPQALHISEFGPIAAQSPRVAENIVRGSMNAVPITGRIDVETTMEGGEFGECYALFALALKTADIPLPDLSPLDWKIHFFSWLGHPSYKLSKPRPVSKDTTVYFDEITTKHRQWLIDTFKFPNGVIPLDRQAWYEGKKKEQGEWMWQQYPTVVEECVRSVVTGQIYPEMTRLRLEKRVTKFNLEPGLPIFVSADLGSSDNTALWLIQPAGHAYNVTDCSFGEGLGAAGVAEVIRRWDREYGFVEQILIPHDARITDKGSGLTYEQNLVKANIAQSRITVVPRTPDVWAGIEQVRRILPNVWFHSRTDEKLTNAEGRELPSGVMRIQNYRRRPPSSKGTGGGDPMGDICSHAADALRTFAEAKENHLVRIKGKARVGGETAESRFFGDSVGTQTKVMLYE